jgi:hypothetical protein
MFDPELKYCPKCNDEYLAHIENCGVCATKLLTGDEMSSQNSSREERLAGRKGALTVDDEIVIIQKGTLQELKRLEELLEKECIGVMVAGDEQSCSSGKCGPGTFYLQVRAEEAQDALKVLQDEFDRTTNLAEHDLSNNDAVFTPRSESAVCPACGCEFNPTSPECPDCGLCLG